MNRTAIFPIFLLWLLLAGASSALEVGTPVWGFDGKVPPSSFALLSVEVRNPTGKAFEGDLVLNGSGVPLKQRIFVAPGTTRWVQFHPYTGNYVPNMSLAWNDGRSNETDMEQPKTGPPAVVILADPEAPGMRSVRMRVFSEKLFPTTVSATDGLGAVVLDHQPRFDAPRREAFLDWLRRGGTVHVILGADGAAPQFSDDFAPLNTPDGVAKKRVGAGIVARHDITRAEITEQWLAGRGFAQGELRNDGSGNVSDPSGFIFRKLAAVTRPNIKWGLIYTLTVVYVLLIGPAFYLLRKRNYRVLLGGFLVTVALFSWLFTIIGRRGYGEKQIYHSAAIARSLGEGRFDVQQWIHAFATSGDNYTFSHGDSTNLYGVQDGNDNVRGEVVEGKGAHFTADIPLFSSRPFIHRGVLKSDDPVVKVEKWTDAGLAVNIAESFRKRTTMAVVECNGLYAELAPTDHGYSLPSNSLLKTPDEFLGHQNQYDYGGSFYWEYTDTEAAKRELRSLHAFFIGFANGEQTHNNRRYLAQPPRGPDRARLFLYAEAPPGFAMKNDRFESGISLVLYVFDIFKP